MKHRHTTEVIYFRAGHELVTDMLLQNNADRHMVNNNGKSPVDLAREEGK